MLWLLYDEDCQGVFCKECKKAGKSLQRTGGTWVTKPFTNWKKALEKMKAHSQSDIHVQAFQASMLAEGQQEREQSCNSCSKLQMKRK